MAGAPRLLKVLTQTSILQEFNLSATEIVRTGQFSQRVRAMPRNEPGGKKEGSSRDMDYMDSVPEYGVLVDMTERSRKPFEEEQQRHSFDKQLEMLTSLRHPCVLTEVMPFLCARYFSLVLGATCRFTLHWIITEEALSPESMYGVFVEMAAGLTYLHQNNIAHLGLDLTSFLLDSDGHAVISGFSRAVQVNSPRMNVDPGWPTVFRAPELQEAQGPVDPFQVDLYSLGAVLYCLLHGTVESEPRNLLYLWCIYGGNDLRESDDCGVDRCFWNHLVNLLQHHPHSRWGDSELVRELCSEPKFFTSGSEAFSWSPLASMMDELSKDGCRNTSPWKGYSRSPVPSCADQSSFSSASALESTVFSCEMSPSRGEFNPTFLSSSTRTAYSSSQLSSSVDEWSCSSLDSSGSATFSSPLSSSSSWRSTASTAARELSSRSHNLSCTATDAAEMIDFSLALSSSVEDMSSSRNIPRSKAVSCPLYKSGIKSKN